MKKVIIISTSLRKGSNSDMLADKFIEGATAAEDEPEVPKRAEAGLTGWIDCYPKCELKGTLFCGGVDGPRTIEGNDKLQEAYEMGKSII
ncbi:MAG: hypothetical protein MJZ60_08940 [Bacteroidaceae bacterium]|nr:hypothetical protein [Bacteroidaceae bacterium]